MYKEYLHKISVVYDGCEESGARRSDGGNLIWFSSRRSFVQITSHADATGRDASELETLPYLEVIVNFDTF